MTLLIWPNYQVIHMLQWLILLKIKSWKFKNRQGLKEKRLSLFNVPRWCLSGEEPRQIPTADPRVVKMQEVLPPCVGLVPVLWRGKFDELNATEVLEHLAKNGSKAAPGYAKPEGIVVFHIAGNVGFKKTIDKDDAPKGKIQ